jgi:hypothetical protein
LLEVGLELNVMNAKNTQLPSIKISRRQQFHNKAQAETIKILVSINDFLRPFCQGTTRRGDELFSSPFCVFSSFSFNCGKIAAV